MTRVCILPRAEQDVDEAADEYVRRSGFELAIRFYEAVDRTWIELAEHPLIGSEVLWTSLRLGGIRRWQIVSPFDVHQVFYRTTSDGLEVVRVLHGARDNQAKLSEPIVSVRRSH